MEAVRWKLVIVPSAYSRHRHVELVARRDFFPLLDDELRYFVKFLAHLFKRSDVRRGFFNIRTGCTQRMHHGD